MSLTKTNIEALARNNPDIRAMREDLGFVTVSYDDPEGDRKVTFSPLYRTTPEPLVPIIRAATYVGEFRLKGPDPFVMHFDLAPQKGFTIVTPFMDKDGRIVTPYDWNKEKRIEVIEKSRIGLAMLGLLIGDKKYPYANYFNRLSDDFRGDTDPILVEKLTKEQEKELKELRLTMEEVNLQPQSIFKYVVQMLNRPLRLL